MVGPPKVINKKVNDQLLEPFEVMSLYPVCCTTRRYEGLKIMNVIED